MTDNGVIVRISGPVVVAEDVPETRMYDVVRVGELGLVGEIIRIQGRLSTIQVYEDTSGIRPGEKVINTRRPLSVDLGPGLLSSIYDGIQRPLDLIRKETGDFIRRGATASPLDEAKKWDFVPTAKKGDTVSEGDIIGSVDETGLINHKIMVPFGVSGKITEIKSGKFTVNDTVAIIEGSSGKSEVKLKQDWPVRIARRVKKKLTPYEPLITGQRVIDTFFPVAKGGTVAVPGPFGSGKCVTGDTPVLLGDGTLMSIRDLFENHSRTGLKTKSGDEEFVIPNEPIELMSFNGGRITRSVSNLLYKGKSSSVIRVRTRTGREVRVTPTHKLFKIDETGNIVETPAMNLSTGDFIASARSIPMEMKDEPIDVYKLDNARVLDKDIRDHIAELLKRSYAEGIRIDLTPLIKHSLSRSEKRVTPKLSWIKEICERMNVPLPQPKFLMGDRESNPVRIPVRMTPELAEFLGYYVSEGHTRGKGTVVFTNSEEELLARFTYLGGKIFGLKGHMELQKDKTPNILIHSKVLADFLKVLGTGSIAASKKIPDTVMKSGSNVISSFMTSYYLGDGTFGKGKVELCTSSRNLNLHLSYILSRFGIMHTQAQRRINGTPFYRIYIRGLANLERFLKLLEHKHSKVRKILNYVKSKSRTYDSVDIVPVSSHFTNELYRKYATYSELQNNGIEIHNYMGNDERTGAATFNKFIEVAVNSSGVQLQEVQVNELVTSPDSIYCDRIVKLEEEMGTVDVFDVSVPEYGQNFVGGYGGIVLHNTVVQHQLSKWADSDIVVYVGCGERGNEMTEILSTFPELQDPRSGRPLMERTVLIANTSNMPVAAREASIYTGITIAEYYRDMGYNIALMADSTSRWAEALREISGRLEEMPGEEGYPAYLGRRLSEFYERSGYAEILSSSERKGSVTLVGAVSPPGGDISEPVSQNTLRVTRVFWALDASLASRRHFPSINWLNSYSLYKGELESWYKKGVSDQWDDRYSEAMGILQKEAELQEIVQLVGYDALPEREKATLDIARIIREDFLQQSAFDEVDTYCSIKKQFLMLSAILNLGRKQNEAVEKGLAMVQLQGIRVRTKISRMKEVKEEDFQNYYDSVIKETDSELNSLREEISVARS